MIKVTPWGLAQLLACHLELPYLRHIDLYCHVVAATTESVVTLPARLTGGRRYTLVVDVFTYKTYLVKDSKHLLFHYEIDTMSFDQITSEYMLFKTSLLSE